MYTAKVGRIVVAPDSFNRGTCMGIALSAEQAILDVFSEYSVIQPAIADIDKGGTDRAAKVCASKRGAA